MLGSRAIGLPFLGAVDAAQSDSLRVRIVQDFDGVAIEDGDDGPVKLARVRLVRDSNALGNTSQKI